MPTKFSDIVVDPVNHGYKIGDKNLVSVTTILKSITPEFDKHSVSLRMAERSGVSQAEILRQWEEKGSYSRDKGTRLHQYIEDVMANKIDPILSRVNERLPEMDAFDQAWTLLRSELDAKMVKQEFVVGDADFGVAGRVDNLMSVLPRGSDVRRSHVFDWKSGKLDVDNNYENLLPPFDNYSNCKFNLYSIQLSLYRLIIERNKPSIDLSDGYILHLRDNGSYQLHRARDFRTEIAEWLRDGVPVSAQGDPGTEKRAQDIIKTLDLNIDHQFVKKLSERTCRDFCRATRTALSMLNRFEDSDFD